jgi:hypothetical protein
MISNTEMEEFIETVYKKFDQQRKQYELQQADDEDLLELKQLEENIKKRK